MQNNANTSKKKKVIRHITDDPEIYSDDSENDRLKLNIEISFCGNNIENVFW